MLLVTLVHPFYLPEKDIFSWPCVSVSLFISIYRRSRINLSYFIPLCASCQLLPIHLSAYAVVCLQSSCFFFSALLFSAPSQIHLCLFSFLHVFAAIFSPYLEPDILSILVIDQYEWVHIVHSRPHTVVIMCRQWANVLDCLMCKSYVFTLRPEDIGDE